MFQFVELLFLSLKRLFSQIFAPRLFCFKSFKLSTLIQTNYPLTSFSFFVLILQKPSVNQLYNFEITLLVCLCGTVVVIFVFSWSVDPSTVFTENKWLIHSSRNFQKQLFPIFFSKSFHFKSNKFVSRNNFSLWTIIFYRMVCRFCFSIFIQSKLNYTSLFLISPNFNFISLVMAPLQLTPSPFLVQKKGTFVNSNCSFGVFWR